MGYKIVQHNRVFMAQLQLHMCMYSDGTAPYKYHKTYLAQRTNTDDNTRDVAQK